MATGPQVNLGDATFELKPALINMVQANLFYGKPYEDTNAHLQHFMEVCDTFTIKGVMSDVIRLHLSCSPCLRRRSVGLFSSDNA
jgi:hypothetical protein